MKKELYAALFLLSAATGSAFAYSNLSANDTRYDVRYITDSKRLPDNRYQFFLRENSPWKKFSADHPTWSVLFNEENAKPTMAYGEAIPMSGATVQDKAMNFINTYLLDYRLPIADISLKGAMTNSQDFNYADFIQTYKGLKVIDSRIMIKLTKAGEVLYFKTDVFSDISINISPAISENAALSFAKAGFEERITGAYSLTGLKVLPVPGFHKYEYHLVYELIVETHDDINNVPAKYYTLVDANNGKILYRKDQIDHFGPKTPKILENVTVNGTLYPTNITAPTQVLGLPHLKINSGTDYFTDTLGYVTGVPTGNATLYLEGLYSKAMTGSTTPSMTSNITANPTVSFDANSTDRERTAYYHINIVHDFMKSLPQLATFTTEDHPINTIVDVAGSCNAFYNGSVNFYAAGGGCNATALLSDVMYHEYGHGLNYDIYSFYGKTFTNGAMGEGYADIWAISITNDPMIGAGFYTANADGIRRYDPPHRKVYPQDLVGEVHADGEIIAGAWWEVNLNMGNDLSFMTDLFIRTFPAGADGPSGTEGTIYKDVLVAALQADDVPANGGDNNICNGTPNSTAISNAFAAHGITLYTNLNITHTEVFTSAPNMPITITANVTGTASPCNVSGGNLNWRTSNSASWNIVAMNFTSPNLNGIIPGQLGGTIIQYYIDVSGTTMPAGAGNNPGNIPYYIMVGYTADPNLYDDMGDATGIGNWVATGIGNTTGTWEIAIPIASYIDPTGQTGMAQPGTQVTQFGQFCAVTANAGSASDPAGTADIDAGTTTLESPAFSLATMINPAITYYRTYSDNTGSNPNNDPFVAEISNDGGTTWTKVEHTYTSDINWRRFAFKVLDYTTLTAQMKMRFTASDSTLTSVGSNGQSVSEAALDEFQVWDANTSGINEASVATNISLFPNPAVNNFTVMFDLENKKDISMQITNSIGQILWSKEYGSLGTGNHSYKIDTHFLPSGIYQLRINGDAGTVTQKVSIIK